MRMLSRLSAAALLAATLLPAGLATRAEAQAQPVTRIRGELVTLEGPQMVVASRDGQTMRITLKDDTRISAIEPAKLSDIQPGTFVGTTAVPAQGGTLKAVEVHIFPENLRGTGEGHYDWDLTPGSTMTNANVDAAVSGKDGRQLTLSYKGGSTKVEVPDNAAIVKLAPGDRADLKPHAKLFVIASKAPDGALTAMRISVGRNGVKPPM